MSYPPFHAKSSLDLPGALAAEDFAVQFPSEGAHLEFKQGVPQNALQDAVAAFSNSDGGVILCGVKDDGSVRGLTIGPETEVKIHRIIAGIRDPGRYRIHRLVVGDKDVLVIAVERRSEGFSQLPSGAIPVRRGASNLKLFGRELTSFLADRALARFENNAMNIELSMASAELRAEVAAAFAWPADDPDLLREAGLTKSKHGTDLLTVAGCAFLLDEPAKPLGKPFVEYFRYASDSDPYERRQEFRGPLHRIVAEATEFVASELGVQIAIVGVRRHELPKIPIEVLREAIANAVAHRQYEANLAAVRISHYPDRLVIESPGRLPEPVTLANIRELNAARNPLIIRVLRRFKLAEDAGLGVDLMQDQMTANLLVPPHFEETDSGFRVTLMTTSAVTPTERGWISTVVDRGDIEAGDRPILLQALRGEPLTNSFVREHFGLDSIAARSALQRLRDAGLLAQQGERKSTYYVLEPSLGQGVPRELDPGEVDDLVESLALETPITNSIVRQKTGIDRPTATRVLSRLVAAGRLERRGERRGTHYVLPE